MFKVVIRHKTLKVEIITFLLIRNSYGSMQALRFPLDQYSISDFQSVDLHYDRDVLFRFPPDWTNYRDYLTGSLSRTVYNLYNKPV